MKPNNLFKTVIRITLPVFILVFGPTALAQTVPTTQLLPDTAKMTYNQISQQMKLYVYPAKGQSKQQQKEDEFECYKWAVEQSGIDPLNLPKVEAAPVQSGPTGAAVKGAAKGAAAGAAIGAITGDAGTGAAVGAAAGAMAGRRAGKQAQAQQNQQSQTNAAASEQAMKDSYMKAFSVCIEGKGYTIK
jgi:Sec-independent protein translocase protein TatA